MGITSGAQIVELHGNGGHGIVMNFTVANATAIEKGSLMALKSARTAVQNSGHLGEAFAGIAATEKVVSDGSTKLGLHRAGVFDIMCAPNPAFIAGDLVMTSGADTICGLKCHATAAQAYLSGMAVGMALEDGVSDTAVQILLI